MIYAQERLEWHLGSYPPVPKDERCKKVYLIVRRGSRHVEQAYYSKKGWFDYSGTRVTNIYTWAEWPSPPSSNEVYKELQEAKSEELLEAAIHNWCAFYETEYTEFTHLKIKKFLLLGFNIAQEDGWKHVAPAWLRDYRKHIELPI